MIPTSCIEQHVKQKCIDGTFPSFVFMNQDKKLYIELLLRLYADSQARERGKEPK